MVPRPWPAHRGPGVAGGVICCYGLQILFAACIFALHWPQGGPESEPASIDAAQPGVASIQAPASSAAARQPWGRALASCCGAPCPGTVLVAAGAVA